MRPYLSDQRETRSGSIREGWFEGTRGERESKNYANLDIFNTSNYANFDGFNTLNYADFDISCRKAFGIPISRVISYIRNFWRINSPLTLGMFMNTRRASNRRISSMERTFARTALSNAFLSIWPLSCRRMGKAKGIAGFHNGIVAYDMFGYYGRVICSNRPLSLTLSLINQEFITVGGFFRKGKQAIFLHHVYLAMKDIFQT